MTASLGAVPRSGSTCPGSRRRPTLPAGVTIGNVCRSERRPSFSWATSPEAQAGGLPVIALAKGGALETVRSGETGLLYEDDSVEGLVEAVLRFENETFDPETCRKNALRFSRERFEEEIAEVVRGVSPR